MVALKADHKQSTFVYMNRLKQALSQQVAARCRPFSAPAASSIRCLNFGLAAPIDVQLSGPSYAELFPAARGAQQIYQRRARK